MLGQDYSEEDFNKLILKAKHLTDDRKKDKMIHHDLVFGDNFNFIYYKITNDVSYLNEANKILQKRIKDSKKETYYYKHIVQLVNIILGN